MKPYDYHKLMGDWQEHWEGWLKDNPDFADLPEEERKRREIREMTDFFRNKASHIKYTMRKDKEAAEELYKRSHKRDDRQEFLRLKKNFETMSPTFFAKAMKSGEFPDWLQPCVKNFPQGLAGGGGLAGGTGTSKCCTVRYIQDIKVDSIRTVQSHTPITARIDAGTARGNAPAAAVAASTALTIGGRTSKFNCAS